METEEDSGSGSGSENEGESESGRRRGPGRGRRLTWSELKSVVSELRRQLSSLSTMLPSGVSFRTLPDGRTRVYFLSTPHNGWETTLLYADVPAASAPATASGPAVAAPQRLHWQPVIEANFPSLSAGGKFSREELLLWERKRLATWGITSYELHKHSGRLLFPAASSLFYCTDNGFSTSPLFPTEVRGGGCEGAKISPQICPSNPELVAYVCNYDIWVTHTAAASTARLTFAHRGGVPLSEDPLLAGVPSYVMQEEFSRYQGYWWQPHCSDGVYRILYEETDDSDVHIFCFPSSQSPSGETEEFRFPRAGCANSRSSLKLVQFRLSDARQIVDVRTLHMRTPLHTLFPWCEYLVRVGWTPDSASVWAQLLDRKQQRLELVLLAPSAFCERPAAAPAPGTGPAEPPPVQVVYAQHSYIWINVHDLLHFLPSCEPGLCRFIWASEDTGYRHLYLVTSRVWSGAAEGAGEAGGGEEQLQLQPRVLSRQALTGGEWEVAGQGLWVDAARQLVYFMGLRETPLEKHLYVVSLQRPHEIRLLTSIGYSYSVDFSGDCSMFVAAYSNIRRLPACQVFRVAHAVEDAGGGGIASSAWPVEGVTLAPAGYLLEPAPLDQPHYCPELFTHEISSGHLIYAMVFKPHGFKPGVRYPTVLNVYGGPEVQLVSNTFKGMRQLRMHMLAARGYCVVAIDSRGSQHRGLLFESHLRCKMGTVELGDQVEVLQWLADTLHYIDMRRVAIHGWSYGGYLSLMGLAQYPHVFKLAIAGAPVTSWLLYDTGYTERYMDLPDANQQGYAEGSVLNYISKFPDEENRLLIIHGLIDENVHFYHTSQLIAQLVKAGKPYQLQVYPNERHSLRHLDASKHYETTLLSFLQNNL